MNEAETRAEHIDPALKAAGWGVVEGSKIRREYLITMGRLEGHGRRGKPLCADYVLEYRNTKLAVIEAKAWDQALTEGVGQAKDYAGKMELRFAYSTNGQGIYGIDMRTGTEREFPRLPDSRGTLEADVCRSERMAGSLRQCAARGQRRIASGPLLPGHCCRTRSRSHCRQPDAHSVDAGHGHWQDLHCVSDCVEAFPQPLEPEPRTDAASADPVSGGPEYSR